MQPRTLLTVALLALLASARAEEEDGSLLLGSVQGYMEQASRTVQDALSSVHESDLAVVARGWMDNRFRSLKGYWSKFTDKFTSFWDSTPVDQPIPAIES
ncbi:apolipoprotein C-III [Mus pahari]|uniref:apolipoprotein C-III n=1 Tax=Mus pahari TaxID=10093 RepID=UPI000A306E64|nr:apolipoprotein C-III [Mus pahari]